jgi:hypothetical protein
MTHDEIMQVEYYDQLADDAARADYRENTVEISPTVAAEFDRIDSGLKAHILS